MIVDDNDDNGDCSNDDCKSSFQICDEDRDEDDDDTVKDNK